MITPEHTAAFLRMAAKQLRGLADRSTETAVELTHIAERCEAEAGDLVAILANRATTEPLGPEQLIAQMIERHRTASPAVLARILIEELWEAGYDMRPRTEE